jgi:cytochrome c-type biogenesis protein CcmH
MSLITSSLPIALLICSAVSSVFVSTSIQAASTLADFTFTNAKQTQEFRNLIEQLRCLVCQNESLAASQAELAQDLRREIYAMMRAGQTQEQIVNFLVERYGDFVLYNPPMKPSTYFLWYSPFILFILGGGLFIRSMLRQQRISKSESSTNNFNIS